MTRLYIDTETTGLKYYPITKAVQIAIVDEDVNILLNSLCNPGFPIPPKPISIHGITDEMVAKAPPTEEIMSIAVDICSGRDVVIYNAAYDTRIIPELRWTARSIDCCMLRYSRWKGEINEYYGSYRWHKLTVAAAAVGFDWSIYPPHSAVGDCFASRAVWSWLDRVAPRSDLSPHAAPSIPRDHGRHRRNPWA